MYHFIYSRSQWKILYTIFIDQLWRILKKVFLNTRINYFLLAVRHCIVKKKITIYVSKWEIIKFSMCKIKTTSFAISETLDSTHLNYVFLSNVTSVN